MAGKLCPASRPGADRGHGLSRNQPLPMAFRPSNGANGDGVHRTMDRGCLRRPLAWLALGWAWALLNGEALGGDSPTRDAAWQNTLLNSRESLRTAGLPPATQIDRALSAWHAFQDEFAQAWDWILQDCGPGFTNWFTTDTPAAVEDRLLARALEELGSQAEGLRAEWREIQGSPAPLPDPRRLGLYARACEQRRAQRSGAPGEPVAADRLHQAPHPPPFVLRLHGRPVRRAERAAFPAGLGAVPAGDGRTSRQSPHAARRPRRGHPRSGRLLGRQAGAVCLEEIAG